VNIGSTIRRLRTARGMTRERLSREADVPLSTLAHLEQGRQQSVRNTETLVKLAHALACTVDELLQPAEEGVKQA